jgi:hypothetical protein
MSAKIMPFLGRPQQATRDVVNARYPLSAAHGFVNLPIKLAAPFVWPLRLLEQLIAGEPGSSDIHDDRPCRLPRTERVLR